MIIRRLGLLLVTAAAAWTVTGCGVRELTQPVLSDMLPEVRVEPRRPGPLWVVIHDERPAEEYSKVVSDLKGWRYVQVVGHEDLTTERLATRLVEVLEARGTAADVRTADAVPDTLAGDELVLEVTLHHWYGRTRDPLGTWWDWQVQTVGGWRAEGQFDATWTLHRADREPVGGEVSDHTWRMTYDWFHGTGRAMRTSMQAVADRGAGEIVTGVESVFSIVPRVPDPTRALD